MMIKQMGNNVSICINASFLLFLTSSTKIQNQNQNQKRTPKPITAQVTAFDYYFVD